MIDRIAFLPTSSVGRAFAAVAAVALAAVFAVSVASAQQPRPKPGTKAPQKPPAQAPAPQQPQAPQLIYSPWTKFCLKGQQANAKQVCFTGKDARIESGRPIVAAVLIEPQGEPRKVLRVTVPLGVQLQHGTRVIIDQDTPINKPYVICFANGCMSDYDATPQMIEKMKKGKGLTIQAINAGGQPISLVLPLAEFAKAHDGPPTDPKVFEAQQKKLQEELQKRAQEAREKLEAQQPKKK
jgi:invasion protein IalB